MLFVIDFPIEVPIKVMGDINKDTMESILRRNEEYKSVKVRVVVPENGDGSKQFNDYFASSIQKFTIETEDREELGIIAKCHCEDAFHKFVGKAFRPFSKSIFWYCHALPSLAKEYPEIQSIAPKCYYGYCNRVSEEEEGSFTHKTMCEKLCCLPCVICCDKREKGIIIMENICHGDYSRSRMLDKQNIMTLHQVFKK